jgi:hypothetical protein
MHHFAPTVIQAFRNAFELERTDPGRSSAIRRALTLAREESARNGATPVALMSLLSEQIAQSPGVKSARNDEERARETQLLLEECLSAYFD